ncbi:type I phosphomannose isomerase catalytic subunit [Schlesneria sp. T3-172]|uniref:type I phosphomannose isomerase catalytic subunit n=1 Tax=Schlesneria sphaerica TaxID=3373610 RepID=UPI0037CCAFCD
MNSPLTIDDPLVFDTFFRPQVWGGRGIQSQLGRALPCELPYGEAWELSSLPLHESRVLEGKNAGRPLAELWTKSRKELTGGGGRDVFPLLLKWLECKELLSLQVHPDDAMAQRLLNEPYGKSEAWVIVSVEPTARIYAGLQPGVTREDFLTHMKGGTVEQCLHSFVPRPGDCVSIPAGTIHAAGGGLIIAEVQQSSDATFRLFDWNRLGLDGKPRPLQIDKAVDAINWDQGPVSPVVPEKIRCESSGLSGELLVDGVGFRMERYTLHQPGATPHSGEFTVWMVLEGEMSLTNSGTGYTRDFQKGSSFMIPASAGQTRLSPKENAGLLTLLCVRLT